MSPRVFVVVAVVALAGCSSLLRPPVPTDEEIVGCTLEPVAGTLRIVGEQSVIENPRTFTWSVPPGPLTLRWPAGWRVVAGQVRSADGRVQASAGQQIAVAAISDNGSPRFSDGAFLVCPQDVWVGPWPQQ